MTMGVRALFRVEDTNSDALLDFQSRIDQVDLCTEPHVLMFRLLSSWVGGKVTVGLHVARFTN